MSVVHPLKTAGTQTSVADVAETGPRRAVVLRGRSLTAARASFAVFTGLAIWLNAMVLIRAVQSADGLWLAAFGDPEQARAALSSGGFRLVEFAVAGGLQVVSALTFFGVATLIVWRSREAIAFLVALLLVSGSTAGFPGDLFDLMSTEPVRAILGLIVTYFFPLMLLVIFFVFPDGRFTPRWTIIPTALWAGSLAWTFFVVRSLDSSGGPIRLALPVLLLSSVVVAQVHRYRRVSRRVERQQTKWFLSALGLLLVTFVGGNIALALTGGFDANPPPAGAMVWTVFEPVSTLVSICLPIALAVAVLKYRLFDLNLIVNRALVYGGLTVSIVGIYVMVVGYLGTLFRTGGNLPISLVATTLVAISFQPIRARLQRGVNRFLYGQRDEPYAVVARLGRRLEGSLAPTEVLPAIVETVAAALKLPYVAIALQRNDAAAVAAAIGDEPDTTIEIVPLVYHGERVGELRLAPRTGEPALAPADRHLVDDLARQAGMAVHAVQLTHELQRARARLVTGREEERRRLRRDLHDGLGPTLASQALTIDTARVLIDRDSQAATELLLEAKTQSQTAVSEIRRVVYELRPPALDDLGLEGALRDLAAQFVDTNLEIAVETSQPLPKLSAAVEVAAYRIVQEALTNVTRHAQAGYCWINLTADVDLRLTIIDDGIGIPVDRRAGVGLTSMRERAEELGGMWSIAPGPKGGTTVSTQLPLNE